MKVLHINDYYEPVGGTEVYLRALLDALEERRVETVVVCHQQVAESGSARKTYGVAEIATFSLRRSRAVVAELARILSREKPDVIHLHRVDNPYVTEACQGFAPTLRTLHNHNLYCPGGVKFFPSSGAACQKPFGPLCLPLALITHCGSRRPPVLFKAYAGSRAMLHAIRSLKAVLVASKYIGDLVVNHRFPKELLRVLPYFTKLPSEPKIASQGNMLLFMGRIVRQKGLDVLLKSLRHVQAPFRLVIGGDGPDLMKARRFVSEVGLEKRVEFRGWISRDQQCAYYRRASVVVVPSVWPEPFGITGIEAMSYGKPIVAFNVGGIPEWLENGVTGFLVNPYDVKEMAEKICYLLEHPKLAAEMGMRGRERVARDFSQEEHVTRLLEIYREVIDGRSQPPTIAD